MSVLKLTGSYPAKRGGRVIQSATYFCQSFDIDCLVQWTPPIRQVLSTGTFYGSPANAGHPERQIFPTVMKKTARLGTVLQAVVVQARRRDLS